MLHWSFQALARQEFPAERHDGRQWKVSDEVRESLAGKPLGLRGALLHIKGDWGEFSHSLGLLPWSSNEFPCPFGTADRESMYGLADLLPLSFPFDLTTAETYDAECRRCEIRVTVPDEAVHRRLKAALVYDKRDRGSMGAVPDLSIACLGPGGRGSCRAVCCLERCWPGLRA